MRGILGILAGLAGAIVTAMLIGFLGAFVVGAAAVDMSSSAAIKESYSSLSVGQQLLSIAAWGLGGFVGAYVAKRISGRSWPLWTVTFIVIAYQLISVALLPMPGWMQVTALAAPLIAGFIANRLVPERIEVTSAEAADETAADADA